MNAAANAQALARSAAVDFSRFKGAHQGKAIVVCGCGESANELTDPGRYTTIGVNDIGRLFHPDYLVVVNPRNQFSGDRFRYVATSQAPFLFTQYDNLGVSHPGIVKVRLGKYAGTDFSDPTVLHHTQNSPYIAVCLAVHMGAKRIGLIGVDFTENHFFGKTGRHPLAHRLERIDQEYANLARACQSLGIELVNLSARSRLASLPKMTLSAFDASETNAVHAPEVVQLPQRRPKVFFVNYHFLSCGDVFTEGLRHGAEQLGLAHSEALWDDPHLPAKVKNFAPDLLFVVHGRRFTQKWGNAFAAYNSAVWLLDEPYEVDDTAKWSHYFKTVFVNDPITLERHRNSHYLPVCFNRQTHFPGSSERQYKLGFIGGYNEVREHYLVKLAQAGLLGYVVGGPWKAPELRRLCLAANIPSSRTAELYRQTEIVVNVFRAIHHYNVQHLAPQSMNPRIYEALACGAAVVSERRREIDEVFPELPRFENPEELVAMATDLLADKQRLATVRAQCQARLEWHSYADRLTRALEHAVEESATVSNEGGHLLPAVATRSSIGNLAATGSCEVVAVSADARPAATQHSQVQVTPRRNLIYHIWPVRGSTWKWNLDQLKQRIDLFNGRRIISIVHDARSEPPEAVQSELAGHGCEYIIAQNNPRGEATTFVSLLDRVRSPDATEVTFYGHGKGVKYAPAFPPPLKKWVETLYRVTLDDWAGVKSQLGQHAMTGAFKKAGRFRNHQYLGDWHYSGTFFWFRNADVFSRDYRKVPDLYWGVEAWPGLLFPSSDTGCLFCDGIEGLPYEDRFWRNFGNKALASWQSRAVTVPPPLDLARPRPYEGFESPRLEQIPEEFDWWIATLLRENVRSLLTIGAGHGGVEWHVARKFREHDREIEISAIDNIERSELVQALDDARNRFKQQIGFVPGSSQSPVIVERLKGHYDAVFIDGDHGYRSVSNDYRLALSRSPRLIGFHDIVDSDWHAAARCCVSRIWHELVAESSTEERRAADWGGIGVVWPDRRDMCARANAAT